MTRRSAAAQAHTIFPRAAALAQLALQVLRVGPKAQAQGFALQAPQHAQAHAAQGLRRLLEGSHRQVQRAMRQAAADQCEDVIR